MNEKITYECTAHNGEKSNNNEEFHFENGFVLSGGSFEKKNGLFVKF